MEEQRKARNEIAEKFQSNLDHVLQVIESAKAAIPADLNLDSKLLVESQLLQASAATKEEPADDSHIDSLDQMMCKIVDDMT
nr:hypothetical protein BaRGS_016809 [Batillaria attramentaria]